MTDLVESFTKEAVIARLAGNSGKGEAKVY